MATISIQDAQAHLPEVIERLAPGEEVIVTQDDKPVAKLARAERTSWPCRAGTARDTILEIAPDFDAPLDDFREDILCRP